MVETAIGTSGNASFMQIETITWLVKGHSQVVREPDLARGPSVVDSVMSRYMQLVTGSSVSHNVVIAMSGIAKVFIGEIVEEAIDTMEQWSESGPLQPKHIREAVRRLKAHDQTPTAKFKQTLFK